MKQTAVQWLLDNLILVPWAEEHFKYNSECWDKALEMEKEQIESAWNDGRHICGKKNNTAEEYYNENYETQND